MLGADPVGHAMQTDSRIIVAGHRGLVGSAIVRQLADAGCMAVLAATCDHLDLRDQAAVNYWSRANRPEFVFLVAGTVGGILANSTRPAEFIYDKLLIHATVLHAAYDYGATKWLYLAVPALHARESVQPMTKDLLLTGAL
jgi:GDP-L-fucose synthase